MYHGIMENNYIDLIKKYSPESFYKTENKILSLMKREFYEIMINRWDTVYIEDKKGMRGLPNIFQSKKEYLKELNDFLSITNQRISIDKPIINFDYMSKYRINMIHPSISTHYVITIRKSHNIVFDENYFLSVGFFTVAQFNFLKHIVQSKKTLFISGGTSTGKTTLLKFLLHYIDKDERLVVIEDTKEIVVPSEYNVVYLRTQEGELSVKEVSSSDLVKTSLRVRPDRILMGEIRRDEVVDFLHAINTGHSGSISTGHGNSAIDMISRLEILLIEAGIPYEATARYLGRGIDYIVQLGDKTNRRVHSISEVRYEKGKVVVRDVFKKY